MPTNAGSPGTMPAFKYAYFPAFLLSCTLMVFNFYYYNMFKFIVLNLDNATY